ncbi:hypothetical protein FRX31_020539 [Thalictrum thalictroides]|uniref:Uncharacterized protein n=1 Tax=Thalictrum thalictroides TaxID=46969 RepID=A0A7J6VXL7_THATH|nr:hypothetical protein FRX31_020539 [Thalictrum thalictroides]
MVLPLLFQALDSITGKVLLAGRNKGGLFQVCTSSNVASGDTDDEQDEDMEIDASKKINEVSQALAAADALGKNSETSIAATKYITDALRELDMDHYDDEDDGT